MTKRTKIFDINGQLFVADTVEDAIKLFREEYPFPNDIQFIHKVEGGGGSDLAYEKDYGVEPPHGLSFDGCQDPNYIQSLTISDEPIPVCEEPYFDGDDKMCNHVCDRFEPSLEELNEILDSETAKKDE